MPYAYDHLETRAERERRQARKKEIASYLAEVDEEDEDFIDFDTWKAKKSSEDSTKAQEPYESYHPETGYYAQYDHRDPYWPCQPSWGNMYESSLEIDIDAERCRQSLDDEIIKQMKAEMAELKKETEAEAAEVRRIRATNAIMREQLDAWNKLQALSESPSQDANPRPIETSYRYEVGSYHNIIFCELVGGEEYEDELVPVPTKATSADEIRKQASAPESPANDHGKDVPETSADMGRKKASLRPVREAPTRAPIVIRGETSTASSEYSSSKSSADNIGKQAPDHSTSIDEIGTQIPDPEKPVDVEHIPIDLEYLSIDVDCTSDTQVCLTPILLPTLLPIFDELDKGSRDEENLETKKLDVIAQGASRSLLPYTVKAIPEDFEQPMFIFKYGVLAKWHNEEDKAPQDEVEVPLPTPPFCCGGDTRSSQPIKRKRDKDEVCEFFIYLPLCRPNGAREDDWVKPWSIHSGRFKVLHMMPPDDIPRFPPPEEPPDPPIPPDKNEPG